MFADGQNEENQVATPLIGMPQQQGPWPKCLGMESSKCVKYIESLADDLRGHVDVISPDQMVTLDLNPHRVRVFVDGNGLVNKIPERG